MWEAKGSVVSEELGWTAASESSEESALALVEPVWMAASASEESGLAASVLALEEPGWAELGQ